MSLEIDVLRALFRLAHRRSSPTLERLVVRVGAEPDEVCRALRSLARDGFVQRTPAGLRLTLAGLAVAVACARRAPSNVRPPVEPSPIESPVSVAVDAPSVRRRHAA